MPGAELVEVVESGGTLADRRTGSDHPVAVYLANLSAGSRRTMRGALDAVADIVSGGEADAVSLDWSSLRYQHTQAIRTALAERYAPATANKMLSALRGVLKESWRLGYVDAENYRRAADIEGIRGESLLAGRSLSAGELRSLFAVCATDASPAGIRDAALLAILYGAGLRRAEAVALSLGDYDRDTGRLTIQRGKGAKARLAHATNGAKRALDAWLDIRGETPGALLCPVGKSGQITIRHMTGQAVLYVLRKRASQANIKAFTPHDLRRTFIGDLLDAGADIATIQQMAGHASVQTTARYDRRPEATRRKAAELLHIPYAG